MELTIEQALQKGIAAHRIGNTEVALRLYTAILKLDPCHAHANHNLGRILIRNQRASEALPLFQTAIAADPLIIQFYFSLVDTYVSLFDLHSAKLVLKQAIDNGVHEIEQLKICEYAEKAIKNSERKTDISTIIRKLSDLYNKNSFNEIFAISTITMKRYPRSADIQNIRGAAFAKVGDYDQAIQCYKIAAELSPNSSAIHNNMGNALMRSGDPKNAILNFEKAVAFNGKSYEALNNLGNALQAINQPSKAMSAYKKAIEINPKFGLAHRHLSTLIKYTVSSYHLAEMKRIIEEPLITEQSKCHLSFALAKAHDDIADYETGFNYLELANKLASLENKYSVATDQKLFLKLKDTQPILKKISLHDEPPLEKNSPIFIIGMPRSGTTLIENIISNHTMVTPAGELDTIGKLSQQLLFEPDYISRKSIQVFRKSYLEYIQRLGHKTAYTSDKMPQNFRFLPFIIAAFPEAKIVHVKRNAKATCWSNYQNYFRESGLSYSYDLDNIREYYKMYEDLMEVWRSNYPQIIEVDYEALVENPDCKIRELLIKLKLNFDPACLEPQTNNRTVTTASQRQVRRKIYKGSSKSWKNYEKFVAHSFSEL